MRIDAVATRPVFSGCVRLLHTFHDTPHKRTEFSDHTRNRASQTCARDNAFHVRGLPGRTHDCLSSD